MEQHDFDALLGEMLPTRRHGQLLRVAQAPNERVRLREVMDAYLRTHPIMAGWGDARGRASWKRPTSPGIGGTSTLCAMKRRSTHWELEGHRPTNSNSCGRWVPKSRDRR